MATTLILVRHAHALPCYKAGVNSDTLRPLSDAGREKAAQTAQTLAGRPEQVKLILTSPLLRAVQTAQILSDTLNVPVREHPYLDGMHPDNLVCDFLVQQARDCGGLLAVGHNPAVTYIAALLCGQVNPFSAGAFAVFDLAQERPQLICFGA